LEKIFPVLAAFPLGVVDYARAILAPMQGGRNDARKLAQHLFRGSDPGVNQMLLVLRFTAEYVNQRHDVSTLCNFDHFLLPLVYYSE
jgi:hypothetical protein